MIGLDPIPNIANIIDSANFEDYKKLHPEIIKLKYIPEMKRQWKKLFRRNDCSIR